MAADPVAEARRAAELLGSCGWKIATAIAAAEASGEWDDGSGVRFDDWAKRTFRLPTRRTVGSYLRVGRFLAESPKARAWKQTDFRKASVILRLGVMRGVIDEAEGLEIATNPRIGRQSVRDRFLAPVKCWRSVRLPIESAINLARAMNRARYLLRRREATDEEVFDVIAATFRVATLPIVRQRGEAHPDDVDAGLARCRGCQCEDFRTLIRDRDGAPWCRWCVTTRRSRRRKLGAPAAAPTT